MKGIIYKYTSPSGKSYIGQTVRPEERMEEHKRVIEDGAFHRAIKKYGFENFKYEVLVTVDLDDEQELKQKLDFFEKFYIKKYHSYEDGYNMTLGGDGCLGRVFSDEAKRKMSEAHKGKPSANKGKHFMSDEAREKISSAKKGKKLGVMSDEHKQKLSDSHKGKVFSDEHKAKISEVNKGKTMSEETKRKMSESLKLYHQRKKLQKSA